MLHAVDQIDVGDIGPVQRDVQIQPERVAAAIPQVQDQLAVANLLVLRVGVYPKLVRAPAAHGTSSIALLYI